MYDEQAENSLYVALGSASLDFPGLAVLRGTEIQGLPSQHVQMERRDTAREVPAMVLKTVSS